MLTPAGLYGPGTDFGELALREDDINSGKTRKASVVCREKCRFAVLTKDDYQEMLGAVDRRYADKMKDFLRQIPFLRILPRTVINSLLQELHKKKFQYGQFICHEGCESDHIFIVINGELEISKMVNTNEQ